MPEMLPTHLMQWIEQNKQFFRPPVANREVFPESEFIFQIIRGPNARNDFHIDPGDEIFYQLKGDITVQYIDGDGKRQMALVREGEAMLCRAGTPHCPVRPADTWGLVIERKRRPDELDRLAWFCQRCQGKLHEVSFSCENIETQLKEAIQTFNASEALRTCTHCGAVLPVPSGAN
ncbi:MAG: 3-hydroxyanthranilate 3,4-dioxygenase [Deltaproteobacteria bacterium]|nr:3-hydroxyanthranilate 3,4-dioxygenase [Deltaproteobacteria bacterium]MBI3077820.1 3-hydroxyanthranilate 3,4-dioxygenase [Deltaproteobacteria bacterium]